MRYVELEADAQHDIFAWPNDQLKLDRDTVDTQEEIGTSSYLETHRTWVEWMEGCIRKGKPYCVLATDARRMFPVESSTNKTTRQWQYSSPSVTEIMIKSSDAAAARYGKSDKTPNGVAPAEDAQH